MFIFFKTKCTSCFVCGVVLYHGEFKMQFRWRHWKKEPI